VHSFDIFAVLEPLISLDYTHAGETEEWRDEVMEAM